MDESIEVGEGNPALPGDRRTRSRLLRLDEAAADLQIGRSTLYELLHRGELRVVRLGRAVRISAAEIERFVESNEFEW